MKKVLLVLTILFSHLSFGQETLTFTEVVEVEGVSKTELYNRAKIWFSKAFKDSNEVIQAEDKEEGYIIGKGTMKYEQSFNSGSDATNGYIGYVVKIFVKDGRYKYEITDFNHKANGGQYMTYHFGILTTAETTTKKGMSGKKWTKRVWDELKEESDITANILISSMKEDMKNPTIGEKDDW